MLSPRGTRVLAKSRRRARMNERANDGDGVGETAGVSVVVPVFQERENVGRLHERLHAVVSGLERAWEIIYVASTSVVASGATIVSAKTA